MLVKMWDSGHANSSRGGQMRLFATHEIEACDRLLLCWVPLAKGPLTYKSGVDEEKTDLMPLCAAKAMIICSRHPRVGKFCQKLKIPKLVEKISQNLDLLENHAIKFKI